MSEKRGLFVGMSTVDCLYALPAYPPPNIKCAATTYALHAGGPATNAAITFSALGGEATLLSVVGGSPLASVIRSELEEYGVRLLDACADPAFTPVVASIVCSRETGDRNVFTTVPQHAGDYADFGLMKIDAYDVV